MADRDETREALAGAAARTDALRAQGLQGLERAAQARQAGLGRERDRLARRLGADHPRVQALGARMEGAAALRRELDLEVARASTAVPRVGPEEWALHGHVRAKDSSPVPEVTVSLVDARGQWIQSLGFACTDARGAFALTAKVAHPPDATVPILTGFLRVTDADRKELHRGQEVLSVWPGAVDYVEVTVEGGARQCAAPQEGPEPGPAPKPPRPPRPPRKREKA